MNEFKSITERTGLPIAVFWETLRQLDAQRGERQESVMRLFFHADGEQIEELTQDIAATLTRVGLEAIGRQRYGLGPRTLPRQEQQIARKSGGTVMINLSPGETEGVSFLVVTPNCVALEVGSVGRDGEFRRDIVTHGAIATPAELEALRTALALVRYDGQFLVEGL